MNNKDFWVELAKKLTAILAFTVLIVIIIALLGDRIPAGYQVLIYIVVIGGMLIFVLQTYLTARADYHQSTADPSRAERPVEQSEAHTPQSEDTFPLPELPPELPKDGARQAFLQAVVFDNRPLRLAGMDDHAGDPNSVRLSLEEIYIDLDTTTQVEQAETQRKGQKGESDEQAVTERMLEQEGKSRPLSVIEALLGSAGQRMVLLGFPGTGKSTFVRYLALMMAQELTGEPRRIQGWDDKPLLPVAISLGRFAESLPKDIQKGRTEHLEAFLKTTLEADIRTAAFASHLLDTLKSDGALFLFDGLDEVANLALRPVVVEAVENFTNAYSRANPKSVFLVTCRTYSYQDKRWQLTQWPQHELALLTDEQIGRFVTLWYDQHTLLDQRRAIEYGEKKQKLMSALQPDDRRRLSEVARFPIILTVMAVVHASYELPDSRAQVYKQCVDLLLEKWNAKRAIMGQEQTRNILAELNVPRARIDQALYEIAFEAHRGRDDDDEASGGLVTEKLVSGVMTEYLQDIEKVGVFLDYCQKANGLLMLQGTVSSPGRDAMPRRVYTFPHLTFEEYLAGRYLDGRDGEVVRELLDQAHDRWREVTKLLAEYLCFESADLARMNNLLEALSSPFPQTPRDEDWRALWLAGELLTLYKRAFPKAFRFENEIIANLRKLLDAAVLAPRERAAAADILDELGYLPEDLHEFKAVSGEQRAFSIGKYPITNAQYQRFVDAPDFAEQAYWVDFPKFAESGQNYARMGDWGEAGWGWLQKNWNENRKVLPRYWDEPRFGIARAGVPVVGISWYEANAYCKWLLAHWEELPEGEQNPGLKPELIRLPIEAEWVAATGGLPSPASRGAGGEGEERFPWDKGGAVTKEEAEILRRANVSGSGIGRTTPVGMYPLGVSPLGVWDMGGNVWEWQANYADKGHDVLAIRGGSWSYSANLARLSRRDVDPPCGHWYFSGFRVVALPNRY